jgi:hypothetical protein
MIEKFLTIKEAAERLKDQGYTEKIVEAYVRHKKVPYHFRDGAYLIPFPEAEPFFPRLFSDEEMKAMGAIPLDLPEGDKTTVEVKTETTGEPKAPAKEKPKEAPKGTTKNPK